MTAKIRLAEPTDDRALGDFLLRDSMPSALRFAVSHQPSFFAALAVYGSTFQVLVAEENGEIVGCAVRATFPCLGLHSPLRCGRLVLLRIAASHRGSLLAQGFARLRDLNRQDFVPFHLSTVMEENTEALAVLTSGRIGLPRYAPLGTIITRVLPTVSKIEAQDLSISSATTQDRQAILDLLAVTRLRRSLIPAYQPHDWELGTGLLPAFSFQDLLIARRDSKVLGCLGLWDQRSFRQTLITGMNPWFRLLRPVWNLLAPGLGTLRLPAPGQTAAMGFAALPLFPEEDPVVFSALLQRLRQQAHHRGLDAVVLSLHERDPLCSLLPKGGLTLKSRLFAVHDPSDQTAVDVLHDTIPYIEGGSL